jgi:periplasmic protein TonB
MSAGTVRRDVLRWGICFVAVAASHAAAALALLYTPSSSDADFVAGASVVMLDLPDVPAALPTPQSDSAVGPEEVQSEATPPPKEETKPPEETAEVALPEPEPPKPQPPAEDMHMTRPPSVAIAVPNEAPPTAGVDTPRAPSAALLRWQSGMQAQIASKKDYPARARARHEEGFVRITFRIDRNGHVLDSRVIQSSGSSDLDQELLSMVSRAQPLPKPPPDAKDADLSVTLGMKFSLK